MPADALPSSRRLGIGELVALSVSALGTVQLPAATAFAWASPAASAARKPPLRADTSPSVDSGGGEEAPVDRVAAKAVVDVPGTVAAVADAGAPASYVNADRAARHCSRQSRAPASDSAETAALVGVWSAAVAPVAVRAVVEGFEAASPPGGDASPAVG